MPTINSEVVRGPLARAPFPSVPLGLAPHIHLACPTDRVILLDTLADRYRRIGPKSSALLRLLAAGDDIATDSKSNDLAALRQNGILTELRGARPVRFTSSSNLRAVAPSVPGRVAGQWKALLTIARAGPSLRILGLDRTLRHAADIASRPRQADAFRAAKVATQMNAARRWWLSAESCLVSSLALHAELCRRGLLSTLVIGVRDNPFAAHCWVETGDLLLNDDLDTVGELTPILRL